MPWSLLPGATRLPVTPAHSDEVAEHPSTVAALTRSYRDLRDLDAAALDFISAQPTPAPDLIRLQREVEAALSPGWYDEVDLLWTAADIADAGSEPVVIYLPGRATPSEQRFLEALHAARTVVTIDPQDHATRATRVIHASDSDDEVRSVVRDLMARLGEGKKVAVLYADPRPYNRLLAEQLTSAGISFNGPGARPVAERAVVRTFLELLDLADKDLPRAPLFETLGGASVRDFEGTLIPAARWERHSRAAGVVRGDHWDERLQTWIDEEAPEWERESAKRLHEFAGELRRQFAMVRATWADTVDWASELYATLLVDQDRLQHLPPEEQHAHTTLQLALRGLAVLDDTSTASSIRALHDLLAVDLETSIPRVGRFGDGVYVGPISTGKGLAVDVTYVLGLSEDLYPGSPSEDVLLPDRIRAHLDGALPSLRDRIDEQRLALQAAFATAPEVVASFPRGDLRQTKGRLPSRWLLPTLRDLAGDPNLPATKWETASFGERAVQAAGSFAGELLTTEDLATEQEWRVRAAVAGVLTDVVVENAGERTAGARERRLHPLRRQPRRARRAHRLPAGRAGDLPDGTGEVRRLSPRLLRRAHAWRPSDREPRGHRDDPGLRARHLHPRLHGRAHQAVANCRVPASRGPPRTSGALGDRRAEGGHVRTTRRHRPPAPVGGREGARI